MEKKQFDLVKALENYQVEETVYKAEEVNITVRKRVPYDDKVAFANELVAATLITDAELGICYAASNREAVYWFLAVKYYTDVDVTKYEEIGIDGVKTVFEFANVSGLQRFMNDYCDDDFFTLETIIGRVEEAVKKILTARNSLGQLVKGMLTTDINTDNAETRDLIEQLIDMRGAFLEKQENDKIRQFGKKKNIEDVRVGGVKLGLGKKN